MITLQGRPLEAGDYISVWVSLGGPGYSMSMHTQHNDIALLRVTRVMPKTIEFRERGCPDVRRVRWDKLCTPSRVSAEDAADW